jgi:Mg-chelatase subunit ChlD
MAKVVCEDCNEVIAEGVDQEEAEQLADEHTHGDRETILDKTSGDTEIGEGGEGSGDDATSAINTDYSVDADTGGEDGDAETFDIEDQRSPDEMVDDALDEMDSMDDDREWSGWWDVDSEQDYQAVDDEFKRRFESVQEQIEHDRSEVGELLDHRDKKLEGDSTPYRSISTIQRRYDWVELRDDIAQVFRQFKTRDVPRPSRQGDRLNVDGIVRRKAGNRSETKLFKKKRNVARGDRAVHVASDFSGSMHESQVKMAISAVGAATDIIGDAFSASVWTADRSSKRFGKSVGKAALGLITGPDEDFDPEHLNAFETGGGTPTANGIQFGSAVLDDMRGGDRVLIIVTDGKPNKRLSPRDESPTGDAEKDARVMVQEARKDGQKVIGLGVGAVNEQNMANVFGPNGYVMASMDNLAQKLLTVYQDQLRIDT